MLMNEAPSFFIKHSFKTHNFSFANYMKKLERWHINEDIQSHSIDFIHRFASLTRPKAWNPKSVNWLHPAHSSVFRHDRLCCANDNNVLSVNSGHLDTHNCFSWKHFSAILMIDWSVMVWKQIWRGFEWKANEKENKTFFTSQLCRFSTSIPEQ